MWQRGLVRKGLGLCHGISGNGYAFLSAYRATQNVEYLQQARGFALYAAQVRDRRRSVGCAVGSRRGEGLSAPSAGNAPLTHERFLCIHAG